MLIHVYIDERPGRIRLGLSHLIPRVVRWCKVTEERKGFYNPAQPSQQTYSVWLCIDSGFNYTTKIYTGNLLSKRLLFTTYLWNINCFLRQTRVCWGRGLQLPKLLLNDIFEVWCYMFFFLWKEKLALLAASGWVIFNDFGSGRMFLMEFSVFNDAIECYILILFAGYSISYFQKCKGLCLTIHHLTLIYVL